MFHNLTKIEHWLFLRHHHVREVFQTFQNYVFAWGLLMHTRFDHIDLISRSCVSETQTAKCVF